MTDGILEVLVEPFKENDPGPHVTAVVNALESSGMKVDMGPFATTVEGELNHLLATVKEVMTAGFDAGATAIQLRVSTR